MAEATIDCGTNFYTTNLALNTVAQNLGVDAIQRSQDIQNKKIAKELTIKAEKVKADAKEKAEEAAKQADAPKNTDGIIIRSIAKLTGIHVVDITHERETRVELPDLPGMLNSIFLDGTLTRKKRNTINNSEHLIAFVEPTIIPSDTHPQLDAPFLNAREVIALLNRPPSPVVQTNSSTVEIAKNIKKDVPALPDNLVIGQLIGVDLDPLNDVRLIPSQPFTPVQVGSGNPDEN